MPAANNLVELRQLLVQRFPQTRLGLPTSESWTAPISTGLPALDQILGGGLARGALTELVGVGPGSGSGLVLPALLRQAAIDNQFLALLDGADSFDPGSVEPSLLPRLLWLRCRNAEEALKAADLLLRDPNVPLVALDLKMNDTAQLRRITSSVWHRFIRLLEQNDTAVLVITPTPLVGGVSCRVECRNALGVAALSRAPGEALASLKFQLLRSTALRQAQGEHLREASGGLMGEQAKAG